MQAVEVVDGPCLVEESLVGVGADDAVADLECLCLYAVEHGCVVVGDEVGHYDANNLRCLLAQALCEGVGPVVQFLGQCLHALAHVLAYLRAAVECTADGGYADA